MGAVALGPRPRAPAARTPDEDLVRAAQGGDRTAFTELVDRYQASVSGIAYGFTGSLSHSEEVAQDTFVVAWRRLADVQQPERFGAWLWGITRKIAHRSRRRQLEQLPAGQVPVVGGREAASLDPSPLDRMISQEEERLLWRMLGSVPEIYRTPLILYYREHKSLERVAAVLDVSANAVKIRLHRGRKLLRDSALAFVESALTRTRPGKRFGAAVLLAMSMPAATSSAVTRAPGSRLGWRQGLLMATLPVLGGTGMPVGQVVHEAPSALSTPGQTRAVRSDALPAWPRFARTATAPPPDPPPAERNIFQFDFEDGELPAGYRSGTLVAPPPGNDSRFCLAGTIDFLVLQPKLLIEFYPQEPRAQHRYFYSDRVIIEFDYWLGANADPPRLMTWNHNKNLFYYADFPHLVRDSWAHAVVRASDLLPRRDRWTTPPGTPILPADPGDRMGLIAFGRDTTPHEPFFIDNLTVHD